MPPDAVMTAIDDVPVDSNGLEVLDRPTCIRLLSRESLGRLAIVKDGQPLVFPINFRVDDPLIWFRTAPGLKLDAIVDGSPVALEADRFDSLTSTRWSVLVTGVGRLALPGELDRGAANDIPRWAPGGAAIPVAITISQISGRRLPLADRRHGEDI